MNLKLALLPLLAGLVSLTGCRSGSTNIPVSRGSETGQAITRMDDAQKQYQKNVAVYRRAMADFEKAHGSHCGNIFFSSLSAPVEVPEPRVQIRRLQGTSNGCGRQNYKVKISYADDPCVTVKTVEVLERISE